MVPARPGAEVAGRGAHREQDRRRQRAGGHLLRGHVEVRRLAAEGVEQQQGVAPAQAEVLHAEPLGTGAHG
jgi:hypothetical protein